MTTQIDEKAVYEAFKNLLSGENSTIRNVKTIQTLIQAHAQTPAIAALLKLRSAVDLSKTVRDLIVDELFTSETKRSQRFVRPVATTPPPTKIVNKSSTPVPNTGLKLVGGSTSKDTAFFSNPSGTDESETPKGAASPKASPPVPSSSSASQNGKNLIAAGTPTNFQTSKVLTGLPYHAQYRLVCQIQQCLEMACFEFSKDKFPDILKVNNWRCWESAELNLSVKELAKLPTRLPGQIDISKKIDMTELVTSITDIRHYAVHRHHLTVSQLETLLEHSVCFLTLIADNERVKLLKDLQLKVLDCFCELKDHELEATQSINHIREQMDAQRLELERQEQAAILKIEEARKTFRQLAGLKVLDAIKQSDACGDGRNGAGWKQFGAMQTSILITISSGIWMVLIFCMKPLVAGAMLQLSPIFKVHHLRR